MKTWDWDWWQKFTGVYFRDFYMWMDMDGQQYTVENLPDFTDGEIEHETAVTGRP